MGFICCWAHKCTQDHLRSGYVTRRHDSNFIVEPYRPNYFSRQFGFCQDTPGDLIGDGTLLTLVKLWSSSICLGTSSKIIILMRPLESAPLMTGEYMGGWPTHRMNPSKGSHRIISKNTKQDHEPMSSKGAYQLKEKPRSSSRFEVRLNCIPQVYKTISKSNTLKEVDMPPKSKLRRLTLSSKVIATAPKMFSNLSK